MPPSTPESSAPIFTKRRGSSTATAGGAAPSRAPSSGTARVADADKPRKERNATETKRRILDAAAAEFAAKGFDGARLGTIARAASVQQALIHHYFVDKEGLHGEVLRQGIAAMTEDVWKLVSRMDAATDGATIGEGASNEDGPASTRPRTPGVRSSGTPRVDARDVGARGARKSAPVAGASDDLRALAEAFVDVMLRFFATNGAFLSILRHDVRRGGAKATTIIRESVGPVFHGIVTRLDAMRERGEVKRDVDTKHLVLSCVAMVAFPFEEEPFVTAIWPADWHGDAFLDERKKHIVEMILARLLPA